MPFRDHLPFGIPIKSRRISWPQIWNTELKAFLKMGLPMGLTQLVQFSFSIVDVVMIGRLGPEHLAAGSLASSLFFAVMLLGLGPVAAVAPLVSQAIGANPDDATDVRHSVRMGLWAVGFLTPIAALIFLCSEAILTALGQPAPLAALARPFVLSLGGVLPFFLGLMILRSFLAALGKTQVPLWIIVAGAFGNAGLNYILIYGNWGAPRLELVGAGLASTIVQAAMFFAVAAYVCWDPIARRFHVFRGLRTPVFARLKEILGLGWPIGLDMASWNYLNIAAVFLVGLIGTVDTAAFAIARNSVATFSVMISFGLSSAGGIRIGLAIGAGDWDRVRRICAITMTVSLLAVLIVAVPSFLTPAVIGSLFLDSADPRNQAVLALIALFLPITSLFMLLDVVQFTSSIVLRTMKDVRMSMVLSAVSYWGVGFPVAAFLGLGTSLGSLGIWWGLLAGLIVASGLLATRMWRMVRHPPHQQPPAPSLALES